MGRKRLGWKDSLSGVNEAAENLLYAVIQQAVEDFRELERLGVIKNGVVDLLPLRRRRKKKKKKPLTPEQRRRRRQQKQTKHKPSPYYYKRAIGLKPAGIYEVVYFFSNGHAGKLLQALGSDINPGALEQALGIKRGET